MAKLLSFHEPKQMHPPHEKNTPEHRSFWRKLFGKDDNTEPLHDTLSDTPEPPAPRRSSKKVIPQLPRPGTFKRQQSELRHKLEPVKGDPQDRRAFSVDPRRGESNRGSPRTSVPGHPRVSAPSLLGTANNRHNDDYPKHAEATIAEANVEDITEPPPPKYDDVFDDELEEELEKKWILNLSMHFKDRSNREKFFVTYAETPTHWRRVTISLDYRDAARSSLEAELQQTQYQRDKSAKIYEAIRDSLPDIQFYDTVTNLKLATEHDRLHVHVTEDVNEVIHFPPVSAIGHLNCRRVKEKDVVFDSHLSGFVYKVDVHGEVFIKKEIPGPDTVEEFLYEINALHRLSDARSVIKFGGVITDNDGWQLKGLLISYAEQGALVDVLYDGRGELSWRRRERWAKQIVQGLSEIHEAGYVQGDFTLSNIVVDEFDEAKIIDINRRGCPVGWEPPEIAALIASKQRISMYIGVKSDLFQLGMVLWAIATQQDEPEIQPRPLTLASATSIPKYYRDLVDICLSRDPRDRRNASYLLDMFPCLDDIVNRDERQADPVTHYFEDFDPSLAVDREDIDKHRATCTSEHTGVAISTGTHTYVNAPTDMSGEPYFFPARGRSPTRSRRGSNGNHSTNISPLSMAKPNEPRQTSQDAVPIVVDVSPGRHYLEREAPTDADRLAEPDAFADPHHLLEDAGSSAATPALQENGMDGLTVSENVLTTPAAAETCLTGSEQLNVFTYAVSGDDEPEVVLQTTDNGTLNNSNPLTDHDLGAMIELPQESATVSLYKNINEGANDPEKVDNTGDGLMGQSEVVANQQSDESLVAGAFTVGAENISSEPISQLGLSMPPSPSSIPLPDQQKDEIDMLLLGDVTPPSSLKRSSGQKLMDQYGDQCYKCKERGHWAADCPSHALSTQAHVGFVPYTPESPPPSPGRAFSQSKPDESQLIDTPRSESQGEAAYDVEPLPLTSRTEAKKPLDLATILLLHRKIRQAKAQQATLDKYAESLTRGKSEPHLTDVEDAKLPGHAPEIKTPGELYGSSSPADAADESEYDGLQSTTPKMSAVEQPGDMVLNEGLERPDTPIPVLTLSSAGPQAKSLSSPINPLDSSLMMPDEEPGTKTPRSSRLYPVSSTGTEQGTSASTPFQNISEAAVYSGESERSLSREDDYVRVNLDEIDGRLSTRDERNFEGDLAGIGGHSTHDHLRYPQGMGMGLSSDDLTIEMRS